MPEEATDVAASQGKCTITHTCISAHPPCSGLVTHPNRQWSRSSGRREGELRGLHGAGILRGLSSRSPLRVGANLLVRATRRRSPCCSCAIQLFVKLFSTHTNPQIVKKECTNYSEASQKGGGRSSG